MLPNDTSVFLAHLKNQKLRKTRVRLRIFSTLLSSTHALTIQEIVQFIPEVHFVSIYRSVEALQKAEIIKQVPQGFTNRFELSDLFRPHHHHATCEICGKTQEVDDAKIETLLQQLSVEAGLSPTKHHIELYGVCASCQISEPLLTSQNLID
jgi:Fe2+ or Zn2+ uptake regulation protein